jgi:hypothetical protein
MGPFELRALGVVCATLVILGVFAFVLVLRHKPARSSQFETDVVDRLKRVEQALETIAIEVERVSESQRFVTKIIADRGAAQISR